MSPSPVLSRRHAAGTESARSLLFTVLGEFVLPHGGSAWTSTVIHTLGRLGVEEKAARQALTRTAADGWLRSERVGRRTRWSLTEAAAALLTDGTARIYGFTGGTTDWDGRWLLVLVRVPESERPTRHRLRTRLGWAGLGSPSPGVWLTTHAERREEVGAVLADAGVLDDAQLFLATHAGGGALPVLVRQAWDLGAIEGGYARFLADFGAGDEGGDGTELARLALLVHAWRRFPWTDPALPRELLPDPWSGEAAGRLFARRHAQWRAAAEEQWRRLDG